MSIKSVYIRTVLNSLEQDGKRILSECYNSKDFQDRTFNLASSYGYCIYVSGVPQRIGFLSPNTRSTESREWYGQDIEGRDEITKFFNSVYSPSSGIELTIAVAMPYGKVLENKGGGIKRKYKVISMAYDKLKALTGKYGATVKPIV